MAPSFKKHDVSERMTLRAGASAVLELPFTASPQPEVSWTYKGGRLPDSRRFKEDTINNMTSLSMGKVVAKDAGDFTVTLKNAHGQCSFTVKLTVLGKYKKERGEQDYRWKNVG